MKTQGMKQNNRLVNALFLAPSLTAFILVVIIPFFMGLYFSLTDWNGAIQDKITFVGLKNFSIIFSDVKFHYSFLVTTIYTAANVIVINLVALILALLVTSNIKFRNFYRSGFFTPNLIGGIVLGYVWQFIFVNAIPGFATIAGIESLTSSLLGKGPTALAAIVVVGSWQYAGYIMMIYVAAIQNVPVSLLEAAQIDGANFLQRTKAILVPLVAPAFTVSTFLTLVNSFKQFDVNVSLTNGGPSGQFAGKVVKATEFLALNIYNTAFTRNRMAEGQAKAVVFFLVLVIVSLVQVYFNKKKEVEM